LDNLNIVSASVLAPPSELKKRYPQTPASVATVQSARSAIRDILDGRDKRCFGVVGPCSIHDPDQAIAYAERFKQLAADVSDQMLLLMRVYFEKPRTTTGWKGFINDPHLDDTFCMDEGVSRARKLLLDLAEMGIPAAIEALDPITPQYLADLVSWSAIGARTTESQTHREMASGLSTPVGIKNGTDGGVQVAINALKSMATPHAFLGIDQDGRCALHQTRGNAYGHVVLRGGAKGPNYDAESVAAATEALAKASVSTKVMIDCSHGNSNKDHNRQPIVLDAVIDQIIAGNDNVVGFMIESHLNAGKQGMAPKAELQYGVSITDACIDWETTDRILRTAAKRLA
jgi:3-deoxy-7-phosphoheptulonate synthase